MFHVKILSLYINVYTHIIITFQVVLLAAIACVSARGISSYPTAKHGPVGYYGRLAKPVVLKDGHIADTHEVAAARQAQHIALAKAAHISTGGYGGVSGVGSGYEGGHGVCSYDPRTGDIYKGERGYAGLHSAPSAKHL